MSIRHVIAAAVLLSVPCLCAYAAEAPQPTVVTVTDTVLRSDIQRFGVNLGGDSWYNAPLRKERMVHGGFEGVIYRALTWGPGGDERSYYDWYGIGQWKDVFRGATYWFVTGPRKGVVGRIVEIGQGTFGDRPEQRPRYFFDQPGPAPEPNNALFIQRLEPEVGYVGQHGGAYWVFTDGGGQVRTLAGDVRPGSRGRVACELSAPAEGYASLLAAGNSKSMADLSGRWRLTFWAKGEGDLTVFVSKWVQRAAEGWKQQPVTLTPDWELHEIEFEGDAFPEDTLSVGFEVVGGRVLLDELSLVQQTDRNPTAFRDDLVATLKKLDPGVIRHLQIGGSTLDNCLEPRSSRMAFAHSRSSAPPNGLWPSHPDQDGAADTHPYGLHEFLELCEEVGADPWYCMPGALTNEEMVNLVEYLAGPVTAPYGKLRAERGHPAAWTEVFDKIHVEIGNEAWNAGGVYLHGGYSGNGEYWNDLFGAAKSAPYYTPKIVMQAGGQASYVGRNERIARETPLADALGLAPYVIHEMSRQQAAMDDENVFSWVFGYPWYHAHWGYMAGNYGQVTERYGKELSIYEVNHHITGGDAPAEARNRIVTGIGGGINVANWMLLMLKEQNVRVQNLFSLLQLGYRMRSGETVRLWGTALTMRRGAERQRPTFLAVMMANKVLAGDLTATQKSGADPKWTCTASYDASRQGGFDVPYVQAYTTRQGKTRGLILFNLHRADALPVEVRLPRAAAAGSAVKWRMAADRIDANNEPEHEVQVEVTESPLPDFATGAQLQLQPFSMTVIRWTEQ